MKSICIAAAIYLLPNLAFAQSSILSSLQAQGIKVIALSDHSLSKIKGTARITGQPMPSVSSGIKIYNMKLNRFGNEHDYRAYRIMGSEWSPPSTQGEFYVENGIKYKVTGDRWLADKSSGTDWNINNATEVDYHFQALHNETGAPLNFGWRVTSWNRPISTFSW